LKNVKIFVAKFGIRQNNFGTNGLIGFSKDFIDNEKKETRK